jgi:hypothetical protein
MADVDWRQFASEIIGHVVWPAVVLTALLIYRRPLIERIKRLKRLEGKGFAAEFGDVEPEIAEALEAEAARPVRVTESVMTPEDVSEQTDLDDRFTAIALKADENPSYAVVASWAELESVIRNGLEHVWDGTTSRGRRFPRSGAAALDELLRLDMLTPETDRALQSLRRLRNEVAHGAVQPDGGSATAYVHNARALAEAIWQSVVRRLSGNGP